MKMYDAEDEAKSQLDSESTLMKPFQSTKTLELVLRSKFNIQCVGCIELFASSIEKIVDFQQEAEDKSWMIKSRKT